MVQHTEGTGRRSCIFTSWISFRERQERMRVMGKIFVMTVMPFLHTYLALKLVCNHVINTNESLA